MNDNKHIILVKRPQGEPTPDCFELATAPVPEPGEGQFLVENHVISIDAGVRGFLDEVSHYGDYVPSVPIGSPVMGMTLGKVVKSNHPDVTEGQFVRSMARWEQYSLLDNALGLEVVNVQEGVPLRHYMGILGPVGLTAWVGLRVIAQLQAGETVVISAAAGATGSAAGQIAKLLGANVIGLAGGPKKVELLNLLGFDHAIDYHAVDDVGEEVLKLAPEGVNVFFDNVGAATLESMLPAMSNNGRVVNCGMIADYNRSDARYGVKTLWQIVLKRLTLRGFMLFDYMDRIPEGQQELDSWIAANKFQIHESLFQGIEQTPAAFVALLTGKTTGKTVVELR